MEKTDTYEGALNFLTNFVHFCFHNQITFLGLKISTKHQTKSDVKTAINVRCKVSLYLTVMTDMFCAVKNTLLMMQYFILMRINFCFTLYNFPHNLLCSFLPPLVETVKEFKEFFNYSFFVIFFFNFVTLDNSLEVLLFSCSCT